MQQLLQLFQVNSIFICFFFNINEAIVHLLHSLQNMFVISLEKTGLGFVYKAVSDRSDEMLHWLNFYG